MSDDIDIEEHGVMFPDMSIVKTETFEYDDEIPDYDIRLASPQPSTSASEAIPDSTTDLDVPCPRVADSPHFVSSTQEEEAASCEHTPTNCIILGSKPSTQLQPTDPQVPDIDDSEYAHCLSAAVELQDWGPFLEKSQGYCKECEILFPTANALDAHKMSVHSFLVAVERNVVKEPVKVRKSDGIVAKECFVCRKSFANEEELIKHIYMHVNTSMQCDVCPETFFSKQLLEQHKLLHKSEEFDSDSTETDLVHKCPICACQFFRPSIYKRHMEKFHNTTPPNFKKYALDLNCPHCATSFSNFQNMYKHFRRRHEELFCLKSNPVAKPKYIVKSLKKSKPQNASQAVHKMFQKSDNQIFVPKSTLFKCTKCNVHFLNCSIAVLHYINCNGSEANSYTCNQCALCLKLSCQTAHRKQHVFGKNFDILDITDEDIRPRILAHCPKCSLHFSETIFWSHIENCDSQKSNHFNCTKCCLTIDEELRTQHEFNHKMLNYKADDYIIIEYGDINSALDTKFLKFYLCQTCKCYMNCHTKVMFHAKMYCKGIKRNGCSLCGLMFTTKTLKTHYGLHEQFDNYNLKNFKFFNLSNNKMIQPMPEYLKCNDCKIFFHSRLNLMHHKCNDEYKTCQTCSGKYSEAAYKLHMAFHRNIISSGAKTSKVTEKNIKETIKMYYCNICKGYLHQAFHKKTASNIAGKCGAKIRHLCRICGLVCSGNGRVHKELHKKQNFKLQNIIFYRLSDLQMIKPPVPSYQLCKKCRVHFCSKIDMIGHKCGEENFSKCKICKIDLSTKAYKLHMPFHTYAKVQQPRKDTKVTSTSIESTPKAKSITYKKHIDKVSNKHKFYQCKRCKFCVTASNKHRHRCDTKLPSKRFTCTKCGLCLSTIVYDKHQDAHKKDPTFVRKNFRIIPFSVTRKRTTAITYQIQRKKVMKSADQVENTYANENDNETQTKDADETTPAIKSQFYYTLFQCKSCNLCMQHRRHSLQHRCEFSLRAGQRRKCPNCGLLFHRGGFNNHIMKHKHDPTYVRKNIKITTFAVKTSTAVSPKIKTESHIAIVMKKSTEDEEVDILSEINDLNDFVKDESIASTTDGGDKTTDATFKGSRLTFFQCSSCKLCILNKGDTKYHRCYTTHPAKRYTCAECGLFLSISVSVKHKWAHENVPTFVRDNFNIIPFSPKHTFETIARSSKSETGELEDLVSNTTQKAKAADMSEMNYHKDTMIDDNQTIKNIKDEITEISKNSDCNDFMMNDRQITENCEADATYASDIDISNDETYATTDADDLPKTGTNKELTFYQCRTCNICFKEKRNILKHRSCFSKKTCRYTCEKCGLFLNKRSFITHQRAHKNPRFVRDNFRIIPFPSISQKQTLREPRNGAKMVLSNERTSMDESSIETESQDNDPEFNYDNLKSMKYSAESKELTETTEFENGDKNTTNSKKELIFYQCSLCNMCVLSNRHKNAHCCLPKQTKRYTCKKCGLFLSKLIKKKHKQAHKKNPLFVRENFEIIPFSVPNNFTESQKQEIETIKLQNTLAYEDFKAKNALRNPEIVREQDTIIKESQTIKSVDNEDTDASDMERNVNMTSDTDTSDEDEKYSKYTFYQCTECKLCVHFERVIKKHRCVTKVSNKRYTCEECGLYLSKRVIQQHQSAHENDPIFIRENFKFIHFSPEKDFVFYQCSSCKTCWPNKGSAGNHKCLSRKSGITYKCDYCGLILSSHGFLKHQASHEEDPTFNRANFHIIPIYIKSKSPTVISETKTAENSPTVIDEHETTNKINDGDTMIADGHKESAKLDEDRAVSDVNNERKISTEKEDCDKPVEENEVLIKADYNQVENEGPILNDELEGKNEAVRDVNNERKISTEKDDCDKPVDGNDVLIKADNIQVENEAPIPNDEIEGRNKRAKPTRSKQYTFYKCKICEGCMPEERVPEHYINKWCRNLSRSKACKKCRNKFIDSEAHASLHKKVKLYRSILDIININDLNEYFDKVDKKYVFQCHGCKTVLFSQIKMEQHKLSCTITDVSDVSVCEKCHLSICKDEISLEAHNLQHQEILDFVHENIRVIYFDAFGMINETESSQKHTLYECVNCKTCVMTEIAVVNHIGRGHCTTHTPIPCKKCGYNLNRFTMVRHDDHHLKFRNMTRENIVIIPFGKKGIESQRQGTLDVIKNIAANVNDEKEVDKNNGDENVTNKTILNDATLYLCKQCDVHLMSPKSVYEHARPMHHRPEHIYPCPECGLNFTKNSLVYHKKIHHEGRGFKLQDFAIIDVQDKEVQNIEKRPSLSLKRKHDGTLVKPPIVDTVYQCTCKLSFLCELSFNEHLEQCDGIETKSGLQCSKCELVFDEKQLLRHSLKHHSSDRIFKYNLKPSEELQSMLYKCGNCYKHFLKKTGLFSHLTECSQTSHQGKEETKCSVCNLLIHETNFDLHKTQHKANIINPNKYIIITYITQTKSYSLYKCNMCDSNFLSEEGLIRHFEHFRYKMHSAPIFSHACDICKVVLNSKGMQEHTKNHHRKIKQETTNPSTSSSKPDSPTRMQTIQNKDNLLKDKDLPKDKDLSSSKPDSPTRMQTIQNKDNLLKDKDLPKDKDLLKDKDLPKDGDFNNVIYYCEVCRLHFENKKSFLCHYRAIRKYQPCDICALVFPNESLSSHVEEHHVKLNLKLEDFQIVKSNCVQENPAKNKTLGKPMLVTKEKIERKVYFKCKNCNVSFLNRKNCLKHMKRHIPLPEYDFIACKICNRNFLVDSLRYHMLHHKSMELNDSTLLTITYSTEYDLDESNITKKTNKFLLGKTSLGISEELTDSDEDEKSPENASDDENNSDNIHSCHLCKKKYKTERARDLHVSLDHLDEEKECPICKKTYHLSILNDLHLCINDDVFKCCICGNLFQTLLMDNHSREHINSQSY